jgi:hypothetical protein
LVIAILTGFNQALIVGAGLYLLAIVFSRKFRVNDQTETGVQEALREPVSAEA